MQSQVQEYRQFLLDNFKGLSIAKPLFYCWNFGLRFNLQTGETFQSSRQCLDENGNVIPLIGDTNSDEYFMEVNKRTNSLFDFTFEDSDDIFFVFRDYRHRRKRLKISNYALRQIENLDKTEISFIRESNLYFPNEKNANYNTAIIKVKKDRINYKNIFAAIGNTDFPPRVPRLDNLGFLSSKEVFFINKNKKLIFNMYDDRGLDIIATDIDVLRPVYEKFNDWILDHDRQAIDEKFNKNAL